MVRQWEKILFKSHDFNEIHQQKAKMVFGLFLCASTIFVEIFYVYS